MAGGDAFFEEGIHWLHLAGSLGPRITSIQGYRPAASREGPDRRVKSMMVAFRYDNDAVGSLYYSREIPSLFRGLRMSKLFGARASSRSSRTGSFVVGADSGLPRRDRSRAFATSAAIRRCIVISSARSGTARAPEMSLERAIDDQRLMDQIYASHPSRTGAVTERISTSSSSAAAPAAAPWPTRCPRHRRAS